MPRVNLIFEVELRDTELNYDSRYKFRDAVLEAIQKLNETYEKKPIVNIQSSIEILSSFKKDN